MQDGKTAFDIAKTNKMRAQLIRERPVAAAPLAPPPPVEHHGPLFVFQNAVALAEQNFVSAKERLTTAAARETRTHLATSARVQAVIAAAGLENAAVTRAKETARIAADAADAVRAHAVAALDRAIAEKEAEDARLRAEAEEAEKAERAAAAAAAAKLRGLTIASFSPDCCAAPILVGADYVSRCTGGFSDALLIGRGAFGSVYRAVDAAMGRRFAVKRIEGADHAAPGARSAAREVAVLTRFRCGDTLCCRATTH